MAGQVPGPVQWRGWRRPNNTFRTPTIIHLIILLSYLVLGKVATSIVVWDGHVGFVSLGGSPPQARRCIGRTFGCRKLKM